MSRHHHHTITNDVRSILHEISTLSSAEVERLYGIEINEDGSVYDLGTSMTFDNISAWAEYTAEDDFDYDDVESKYSNGNRHFC